MSRMSPTSPLTGQTVRESGFRSTYNAAIISISREGARLEGKLGDVRLIVPYPENGASDRLGRLLA
jgi:di/tricarboxylate transporter